MPTERRLDFRNHRREFELNRYVYPVVSRRSKGLSVGVNLNPDKVCNFDCPYCQVDRTTPPQVTTVEMEVLREELDDLLARVAGGHLWEQPPFDTVAPELRRINDVAFAGDGEPTSSPLFADAVELVGELLAEHDLQAVKPIVLTNATLLQRPAVQRGLECLDALGGEIWAKLDAGTEPYFQFVDGTTLPFSLVLKNLLAAARVRPIVIQAMFLRFNGLGPSDAEIDAWVGRLRDILEGGGRIKLVQVYSIARVPAVPLLDMLPESRLREIADRAASIGVPVEVFAGRPT